MLIGIGDVNEQRTNRAKELWECPRERGSASRVFSPSPTSSDRLANYEKVFGGRILSTN